VSCGHGAPMAPAPASGNRLRRYLICGEPYFQPSVATQEPPAGRSRRQRQRHGRRPATPGEASIATAPLAPPHLRAATPSAATPPTAPETRSAGSPTPSSRTWWRGRTGRLTGFTRAADRRHRRKGPRRPSGQPAHPRGHGRQPRGRTRRAGPVSRTRRWRGRQILDDASDRAAQPLIVALTRPRTAGLTSVRDPHEQAGRCSHLPAH
jgi:hypothetical protein